MISVIDGVNEGVLKIMLLKNGKEVSSLSWINVLSFIHKILIFQEFQEFSRQKRLYNDVRVHL